MTPQQLHSGAERPSSFAVNYAGLQQQELTGAAALQNTAASRTQGMQVHSCTVNWISCVQRRVLGSLV